MSMADECLSQEATMTVLNRWVHVDKAGMCIWTDLWETMFVVTPDGVS